MATANFAPTLAALALLGGLALALAPAPAPAQGMPPAARDNIHLLFERHDALRRTVTETPTGYVSLTESDDPQVAAALKAHYRQMGERLESGLMVRRWDPAYEEYVRFHDQIRHKVERTRKGLRITAIGKTPDAIRVARNHAAAVTDFVTSGWDAHDRRHPAVAAVADASPSAAGPGRAGTGCCGGCSGGGCGSAARRTQAGP